MLTHVYLGPGSIQYAEILYTLSDSSPNLTSLDAHLDTKVLVPGPDQPAFPDMARDSNLRKVRLHLDWRCYKTIGGTGGERRETPEGYRDAGNQWVMEDAAEHPALILLRRCSRLERLALPYEIKSTGGWSPGGYLDALFSTAWALPKLRELRWDVGRHYGRSQQRVPVSLSGTAGFPELEQLIYDDFNWAEIVSQDT